MSANLNVSFHTPHIPNGASLAVAVLIKAVPSRQFSQLLYSCRSWISAQSSSPLLNPYYPFARGASPEVAQSSRFAVSLLLCSLLARSPLPFVVRSMDSAVNDFLMVEIEPHSAPHRPKSLRRVSSTKSRLSVRSALSNMFLSTGKVVELSLSDFCAYVNARRSLEEVKITSMESYYELVGVVKHRFIVLELCHQGQENIWLRLDRLRGKGVSVLRFVAARGKTIANDVASLSSVKARLTARATLENSRLLGHHPSLAHLNSLLTIITEELNTYKIWPENCWFFSSLVQQHLIATATTATSAATLTVKYVGIGATTRHLVFARYHAEEHRRAGIAIVQTLYGLAKLYGSSPNAVEPISSAQESVDKVYGMSSLGHREATFLIDRQELARLYETLYRLAWELSRYASVDELSALIAHSRAIIPRAHSGKEVSLHLANLLRLEGHVLYRSQHYDRAIGALERSINIYRQLDLNRNIGAFEGLLDALNTLSLSHVGRGTASLALEPAHEAVGLAERGAELFGSHKQGDAPWKPWYRPSSLAILTCVHCALKEFESAYIWGRQAVEHARAIFRSSPSLDSANVFGRALKSYEQTLVRLGRYSDSQLDDMCSIAEWRSILIQLDKTRFIYQYVQQKVQSCNA
ncbi:hypothetical protein DL93DRAFT_1099596 [Clavulina sp. PMI_390]|nr:hypothetical protein DL93DRAFT_1099596 [Clavulina sp. PMI_390]